MPGKLLPGQGWLTGALIQLGFAVQSLSNLESMLLNVYFAGKAGGCVLSRSTTAVESTSPGRGDSSKWECGR